jgi:xanthine/uracil permease
VTVVGKKGMNYKKIKRLKKEFFSDGLGEMISTFFGG